MTLTIDLPADTESKLRRRAAEEGQDVIAYVHRLIEKDVQGAKPARADRPGATGVAPAPWGTKIDEILAPVREEFERSGMTDEELEQFLVEVRDEVRREKRTRREG